MKKTLGVLCALSLLILLSTGCSSRQVIPVTNNCNKIPGQSTSTSHCALVNQKGCQYIVHETHNFSFKTPARWAKQFTYFESDRSAQTVTDYTLTVQFTPAGSDKNPRRLANLMVLQVLDKSTWDQLPPTASPKATQQILGETDNLVYVVQLPEENPFEARSRKARQFQKLSVDLKEVKENFTLLP